MTDIESDYAKLRDAFEANQANFVLTELETSTVFCQIALASSDPERIERNIRNAHKGYQTALHFWNNSDRDLGDIPEFRERLDRLKSLLQQLGQNV